MVNSSYFQKRVYVGQRGIEGFSWGVDELTDIYDFLDSGLGKPASIRSPLWLWSSALRLSRPTDCLYDHTIEVSNITKNVVTRLPLQTEDLDYLVMEKTIQTLYNKRITPKDNDLSGIEKMPDHAKTGKFQGCNYRGEGLLESLIHRNLPELKGDSTHGSYARYTTSVTPETNDGFWVPTSYLTMTSFDPIMKIKLRLPNWVVATNRFFFGLVTSDMVIKNDLPFGIGDAAIMVGFRNSDSDYKIFRGVGDGVTQVNPYATNHNISQTSPVEIEFGFRDAGTKFFYNINNGAETVLTSNLPQTNRWMKLHCDIQNTTSASRQLDIFYTRMESEK